MIDPSKAMKKPAGWSGPYSPRALPIQPPRSAPTIPRMIVTKIPPGSLPGIMSFAIAPTTSPKIIQPRKPNIRVFLPNRVSLQFAGHRPGQTNTVSHAYDSTAAIRPCGQRDVDGELSLGDLT